MVWCNIFNASRTFRGAPATAAMGGALLGAFVELPELILDDPEPKILNDYIYIRGLIQILYNILIQITLLIQFHMYLYIS